MTRRHVEIVSKIHERFRKMFDIYSKRQKKKKIKKKYVFDSATVTYVLCKERFTLLPVAAVLSLQDVLFQQHLQNGRFRVVDLNDYEGTV